MIILLYNLHGRGFCLFLDIFLWMLPPSLVLLKDNPDRRKFSCWKWLLHWLLHSTYPFEALARLKQKGNHVHACMYTYMTSAESTEEIILSSLNQVLPCLTLNSLTTFISFLLPSFAKLVGCEFVEWGNLFVKTPAYSFPLFLCFNHRNRNRDEEEVGVRKKEVI